MPRSVRGRCRWLTLLTLLGLGPVVSACGANSTTTPNPLLPYSTLAPVYSAISATYASLPHTSLAADGAAMLAFMKTQPHVVASGVSGTDPWIRFSDGTVYGVFNDGDFFAPSASGSPARARRTVTGAVLAAAGNAATPEEAGGTRAGQSGAVAVDQFTATAADSITPRSRALLMGSQLLETDVAQSAANVLQQLGRSNTDYEEFTVDHAMTNMGNLGLLYISAHGNTLAGEYALLTDTPVTPDNNAKYASLLQTGQLITGTAPNTVSDFLHLPKQPYYALTRLFAERQWHMAAHSIAYIDACSSATEGTFISAVHASTYLGWDASVDQKGAIETSAFFFDRLFGEDRQQSFSTWVGQETPPSIPSSDGTVYSVMREHSRYKTPGTNETVAAPSQTVRNAPISFGASFGTAHLIMKQYGGNLIVVPSITDVSGVGSVTVDGLFGTQQGTVTVGGTTVGSPGWSMTEITLPGSNNGKVQVALPGGPTSNVVGVAARITCQWTSSPPGKGKHAGDGCGVGGLSSPAGLKYSPSAYQTATFALAESGYAGQFTYSTTLSTCSKLGWITVTPASGTTFTVTNAYPGGYPGPNGTCNLRFADSNGDVSLAPMLIILYGP